MAKTLAKPTVGTDIGSIVSGAISAAVAVRRSHATQLEAKFQEQVSSGLSYDDQLKYLQKQLDDENASTLRSNDTVTELEGRIADTKKLKRYDTYRTKYQNILQDVVSGRSNAQTQLAQLQSLLSNETDPALRLEIQGDITSMQQEVKQMEDTMVTNQIKKAQYDGTASVLKSTVQMVQGKKNEAMLAGREDDASAYDTWITVLQQQLSQSNIQDATSRITVAANSGNGLNANAKLNELNTLVSGADGSAPVTVNGITYTSERDYWTQTRSGYLAGTGSGEFSDYFNELDTETKNNVTAAIARDGIATQTTLDKLQQAWKDAQARPEVQPFIERAQNFTSISMADAVQTNANSIIDRAQTTGDYKGADATLQSYATKYGISVDPYRMTLSSNLSQAAAQYASAKGITVDQAEKELGLGATLLPSDKGFQVPSPVTTETPATPASGAAAPASGSAQTVVVKQGDTLSKIASDYGTTVDELAKANGISDPNKIQAGSNLTIPYAAAPKASTVAPATPATPVTIDLSKFSSEQALHLQEAAGQAPAGSVKFVNAPQQSAPAAATPPKENTPAPAAQPKTPGSDYQGASIIDYLSLSGQDTSYANRQKLAIEKGIVTDGKQYTGTAEQNTSLLKSLRGF